MNSGINNLESNSFYNKNELDNLGLNCFGDNVLISKKVSIYNSNKITIGNNVRIDDFCILSGNIYIGNNIHIAAGCMLFAGDVGITIKDYSGLSSRCAVYAVSDDYSGNYMTNSTVNSEYRNVISKEVVIEKHVVVGTGSTILPGVTIGEGCAIGAMSLVNKSLSPWNIYAGVPCRKIKERSKKLLDFIK